LGFGLSLVASMPSYFKCQGVRTIHAGQFKAEAMSARELSLYASGNVPRLLCHSNHRPKSGMKQGPVLSLPIELRQESFLEIHHRYSLISIEVNIHETVETTRLDFCRTLE